MKKIMLNVPVSVEIVNGKKKEKLNIEVRDFSKEEKKEAKKLAEKYSDLSFRMARAESKFNSAKKKMEYSEKLEKFADALKYQESVDACEKQLEALIEEIGKLGGDEFRESQAKKNLELLVTGEGVKRLTEVAELKGFSTVMQLILKAKQEAEGK